MADIYFRAVQVMYENCKTVERCVVGVTEEFKVEVELCQGSAVSPFLFAMLMNRPREEDRNLHGLRCLQTAL